MRHTKLALAAMALAVLAGCGGTDPTPGNQTLKQTYTAQVSFGDSLSDVGTYAVGTVKALGGGKYTINGDNTSINPALTGKNWTELIAAQLGLAAPCPAQTGLTGDPAQGFSVPVVNHPGCYGYAQGGARVTNPVGPGNVLTGVPLGQLTVPVVQQVANHLAAVGGKFTGTEVVFVMAGGNDALFQTGSLTAAANAAGNTAFGTSLVTQLAAGATNPATAAQAIGLALATESARSGSTQQSVVGAAAAAAYAAGNTSAADQTYVGTVAAKAASDGTAAGNAYAAAHGADAVAAMTQAGTELANLVKNQIVGNGANHVVVNNLPDLATAPATTSQPASSQALVATMVTAFNTALAQGLANQPKVLLVDVYTTSHDQVVNPGPYGLTNVTSTACDLSPAKNPLGSSLVCNASNLVAGDVSHYAFADTVHPTPFNYLLLARYVAEKMVAAGWL